MKPKFCNAIAFLMLCCVLQAQEEVFIYNGNDKEFFEVNQSVKYIKLYGAQQKNTTILYDVFKKIDTIAPNIFKITLDNPDKDSFNTKISIIDSAYVADELIYKGDGTKQCCFDHILLRTKGAVNLYDILDNYNIPFISYDRLGLCNNEYVVKLSVSMALHYANTLFESGLFEYVQPSFYRFDDLLNPLYCQQWGLKNTGQYGGIVGMDINVEPAWEIATGEGIKVAVIDNGVQLDHPDLVDNLLQGYDATGSGSFGGYTGTDNHGTCCAGIIAACDNTIGIKGIAYNAKIIPIKKGSGGYSYDIYNINAFSFAYDNNADVINCSWSSGSESNMLTNAINFVVENGRNGLGTPVVFATGNYNDSFIKYPASLTSTIAVGAITPCGTRVSPNNCSNQTWGSHYGYGLDVVAPGIIIQTTNINSDYTLFEGTSAACPHAAGVIALMLSANPCLTQEEVRRILHLSCDKLDQYGFCYNNNLSWDYEVGYGKINAYKAVIYSLSANEYNLQIDGNLVSTIDNVKIILDYGNCSNFSAGMYFCRKEEYSAILNFPNMDNPNIIVMTNGMSDITDYNNTNHYASITVLTDTTAILKTWRYYLNYNTLGQTINTYIPSNDNVKFYATVIDIPKTNIDLTNRNISSGIFNRHALHTLHTYSSHISGSAEVRLLAGDSIILHDGTRISPSTGYFYAQSGYHVCDSLTYTRENTVKNQYNLISSNITYACDVDENFSIYPNPNNNSPHVFHSVVKKFPPESFNGINEAHDNGLKVAFAYPNPGNNQLNIRTILPNAHVEVYDINGKLLCNQEITDVITSIDTEIWPSGIYVWKVVSDNKEAETGKWVK